MATEETWEEIIRSNYTDLLRNIDTEHGLYGEVQKSGIFTKIALKSIWDCRDTPDRVDKILRNLQRKDFESFQKFCGAITRSGQDNIVKRHLSQVKDVSSQRPHNVTDSPSDSAECQGIPFEITKCLKQNWNDLITDIECDGVFLTELEKRKTFTEIQFIKLRDMNIEAKRTEQILCLLERGSVKQFEDFCAALSVKKQRHILSQYFKKGPENNEITTTQEQNGEENSEEISTEPRKVNKAPLEVTRPVFSGEIIFKPCSQEFLTEVEEKVRSKLAYKCFGKPRGRAVIINNEDFNGPLRREGADKDVENIQSLFSQLYFETKVHTDKTASEIEEILRNESKDDYHRNSDMFVLILMSHGKKDEIYDKVGNTVKTSDVLELFGGKKCPNLVGKPKLFFIQACQGGLKTTGVSAMSDSASEEVKQPDDLNASLPLPLFENDAQPDIRVHEMADMAIVYATVEGYVAWRRIDTGSLFIQCLVDVFTKRAHESDLMSMLTEVFNELHELEVNQNRYKQIGETRHILRRAVYLLPV